MNFPIKPPLYALDENQINDLVYAQEFHDNIIPWLKKIDHFPIFKGWGVSYFSGLLLLMNLQEILTRLWRAGLFNAKTLFSI